MLKQKDFSGRWFPEAVQAYQLFCCEYVWSPSYQSILGASWQDYEIETGKKTIVKHAGEIFRFLRGTGEELEDTNDAFSLEEMEWEEVIIEKKVLAKIMPTHCRILWEAECDTSQGGTTAFDVPCKEIIEHLQFEQKQNDGYFHNKDGILVAFDCELLNLGSGLLIRKEFLDAFLRERNLRLFWTCIGEKQYFHSGSKQTWSNWSGFLYLDGDDIHGTLEKKKESSNLYSELAATDNTEDII